MFMSFVKIALRNLASNRVSSFINIFGLMTGLTSFLLISLYVFDELTFDSAHKNADNIYRVISHRTTQEGKEIKIAGAGYQVSENAKHDFPEIAETVRLISLGRTNVSTTENTNVFYESYLTGSAGFLKVFSFPLLKGDRSTALSLPHSVIITAETAQKLFNTIDVTGRLMKIDRDTVPFKITGVLKNFPANSHLSFNLIFSESSLSGEGFKRFIETDWNSQNFATYFLLNNNVNPADIESKINDLAGKHQTGNPAKSNFILQPLKEIHFHSADIEGNSGKTSSISYIYIFSSIALFLLLIACINYMNLTTARSISRAKEIAIRKTSGASRKNLVLQFLSEAYMITIIAGVLAFILAKLLMNWFNSFTSKHLALGLHSDYRIWTGLAGIILITGLLAGLYPSIFQSRFKPLTLLKRNDSTGGGNFSIRQVLVVFQFALSILMIFATIVIYRQMNYVTTVDMGFNKDNLIVIDINSQKIRRSAETIKTEFGRLEQVRGVTVSSRVPGEWKDLPRVKVRNENTETVEGDEMFFIGIDDQFLKTYGITLAKGRNFLTGQSDSSSVLINQSAAIELGIAEPEGQMIKISSETPYRVRVIGIVRDFNFQSLRQPLAPMILGFQNNPVQSIDYFTVKVASDTTPTLKQIDEILHSIDQSHLTEYHFLDQQWDLFYREDRIRQTIFMTVAILTIIIACLGLYGLAAYSAEQNKKMIGIRKIMGASVSSIVIMLSRNFLILVLIAAMIALPLGPWMMNHWLHEFAYRISVSWWVFLTSVLAALLIAVITIGFQTVRAANTDPVKNLRAE